MKEKEETTIFIIDDDLSIRKAVSFLLMSEGYEVETLESAESFLECDNKLVKFKSVGMGKFQPELFL